MLKKVLLIGFAILLVAVGFALGATFMRLPSVVPPLSPATLSDAIIGTRCDGDYGSIHPGYQCYYYDVPNTQQRERRGVWIIPDTLAFNLSSLELPLSGSWKTYRSSGAGLSFRYPEELSLIHI